MASDREIAEAVINPQEVGAYETDEELAKAFARRFTPERVLVLLDVVEEVARSGVAFEHDLVDYVTIQIDRITWDQLQALDRSSE